ncbi:MAG: hypothetical protein JW809_19845 [Pirellulales bacterium]|nr:hypothetical protein [Pirellulales bacterium]
MSASHVFRAASMRWRRWLGLVALISVAVLANLPGAAADDEENPHVWKPRTRSVAVFKNGLGFFMCDGTVALRDGWCVAEKIPPAAFGTLAIYAQDEKQMVDVVGTGPGEVVEFDGRDAPKDAAAKRARLEAARNLNVQLSYRHKGQDRTAAGRLVSVGPDFAVLEDDANSFAVSLAGLKKMQILDLPPRIHVADEARRDTREVGLGMAYLRKGITWIPEYTLKVLDDETAELTLRGKPTTAEHGGATSLDSTKLRLLEREGSIRWRVTLEPGEEKILAYRYERYVPSR